MGRGKPGSKMHVLSDANGLPLVVGVSAANVNDSEGLKSMVAGHQTRHDPHNGRHFKPQRLHADKAYDVPHLRKWLRGKRVGVRIARKGVGARLWVSICATGLNAGQREGQFRSTGSITESSPSPAVT